MKNNNLKLNLHLKDKIKYNVFNKHFNNGKLNEYLMAIDTKNKKK